MQKRHLAIAPLLLTLALGACGRGNDAEPASAPTTGAPVTTAVTAAVPTTVSGAGARAPQPPVRTDDLEAELRAVDQELGGAQQSVNQANDTSPEQADG
jgi:hypothetical protein